MLEKKLSIPEKQGLFQYGEKTSNQLRKLFSKDKSKFSLEQEVFYIVNQNFNTFLGKEIENICNYDNTYIFLSDFKSSIYNIVKMYINIIENECKKRKISIDIDSIKESIEKKSIILNIDILKNILKVENLKLYNLNQKETIYNIDKNNIVSFFKTIKDDKIYIINENIFKELTNKLFTKMIDDLKNIFGIIRFQDNGFTEGTHKFYGLENIYKYSENIFLFLEAINKFWERNILEFKRFIEDINNMTNLGLSEDEISIIVYNSFKKYLLKNE